MLIWALIFTIGGGGGGTGTGKAASDDGQVGGPGAIPVGTGGT